MSWFCIFSLPILEFPILSFIANSLTSSMYIWWLIFFCDLLSLHRAVYFLSMGLSDIIAFINSNDDSASPWNIPLWIFTSAKLFPPAVNSTRQVFLVFSIKFMTSSDILYILRQFIIQLCGITSYAFLLSIQAITSFFSVSSCSCWGCDDQCRVAFLSLWILYGIRCFSGTVCSLLVSNKSLPLFVPLVFSTS